jgi:hypothetical protein
MVRDLAAVRGVPGHPRNIAAADADIGEFAVTQARQFGQALVVTPPLPDHADNAGKHSGPLSRASGSEPVICFKLQNRHIPELEKQYCCAAAMSKTHSLSN